MPWDIAEIEGRAAAFRAEHGGDELGSIVDVARSAFGPSGVATAMHRGLVRDAALLWEYDRPIILTRPGLEGDPPRLAWCIAHELGEYILQCADYREADAELVANGLAAAMLMPRPVFARAFAEHGYEVGVLAEEFCAPQSAVALRIGEVCDVPMALVTPTRVHRRDAFEQLPDDATLYLLARVPRVPAPFRRVEITDVRRVAAVAAAA